jgi:hypothetical protein
VTSTDLYTLVNAALAEAQKLPDPQRRMAGAVNWGNLRCVEVARITQCYPPALDHWHVLIEEAEPYCGLCLWLTGRLAERGVADVEVLAEW